jgi:SAM-dependent methyltransferase
MSERLGTLADDPFSGRHPTSHERVTGVPWDASYHDGPAPWDIGQSQSAVVRLGSGGGFAGAVLDAGCGTGENALHIASLGLSVLGVDVAETALAIARAKAPSVGSRSSSLRLMRATGSVCGASSTRCWTPDCFTPSTATSDQYTWRVLRR